MGGEQGKTASSARSVGQRGWAGDGDHTQHSSHGKNYRVSQFRDISPQGLCSSLLTLEMHPSWVPLG